jgi:septation ring formation regulator EzrA
MPLEADRSDLLLQKITDIDNKMELKFDLLTGKIAELHQIATNVAQIQQDVTDLRSNASVGNTEIKRLKHEVEDLQREKASKLIIYDNIPQNVGEDIGAILRQILSEVGCPAEIFPEVAYRLG